MRIGLHQARLNGMGADLIDVGSLSGAGLARQDLQSYLSSLSSYMEQGIAKTPDQVRAAITGDVEQYCRTWHDRCTGGESAAIDAVVAEYAAAYQQAYDRVQANIASGAMVLPAGSTMVPQQPAQSQYTYQAPNALDRTAPQTSSVTTTPSGSALNPPQQTTVVQQTQTQEGTNILAMRPGDEGNVAVGGFEIPVWALVAGGVALFFMFGKGK